MIRDADATRQRLLDAALAEFAEHGIAGARVDRIAAQANSNKAQIYHYFGGKAQLFDAVYGSIVRRVVESTPIDVHDLPGYAAKLARMYDVHPEVMRLAVWHRLEPGESGVQALAVEATGHKVDLIAKAQEDGVLPKRFPPAVLLGLVLHVSATWTEANPEFPGELPDADARYEYVAEAVRRLIAE